MYTISPSSHRVYPLQHFKQTQYSVKTVPKVKNMNRGGKRRKKTRRKKIKQKKRTRKKRSCQKDKFQNKRGPGKE